jgi:hypothetical protein
LANPIANSLPIPLVEPVISATFPFSFISSPPAHDLIRNA